MVTGRKPFPYNNSYALLQAAVNEDPRPPTELEPSLPAAMDAVVLRAMAKDPEERFPTARETRRALEAIARNPGDQISVDLPRIRTRRRSVGLEKQSRRQLVFRALFVLSCLCGLAYLGVRSLARNPFAEQIVAYQQAADQTGDQAAALGGRLLRDPSYQAAESWPLAARGAVALSADSSLLAGGLEGGGVGVWDLRSGSRVAAFPGADAGVAPAFAADGAKLAVAGLDNAAYVHPVAGGEPVRRLAHLGRVTALGFSGDGRRVATGSADGSIRVWELASGESLGFQGPPEGAAALVFSPTGPLLAAAGPGVIRLLGLGRQESREDLPAEGLSATRLQFSENGLELAAAAGGELIVWDMPARKRKLAQRLAGRIVDLSQSPSNDWLALTVDDAGALALWDAERQRRLAGLGATPAESARFGPRGATIAAAGRDGRLTLWRDAAVPR